VALLSSLLVGCGRGEVGVVPAPGAKPWAQRLAPAEARAMGSGGSLLPLLTALAALEEGRYAAPVSMIQIGDSHSFSDFFSGRMRELLQQRFGAAGRGMLPPGVAGRYYRPDLVEVSETEGWQRVSSFGRDASGSFGIAGIVQQTDRPNQQMTLNTTEEAGFNDAYVEVLRRPGGGTLRVQIDGAPARDIATAGAVAATEWIEFAAPLRSRTLTLTAQGDGPVELLSWGAERESPGVLYDNFGTIGATENIIGHWDPAVVADELRRRSPALIVVAFGTNEGFERELDPTAYAGRFAAHVSELAQAAPQAAIVIVGPPDAERRYRAVLGARPGCQEQPPAEPPPVTPVRYGRRARAPAYQTVWAPPPNLAVVRAAQRRVAEEQGWYFWDWAAAMGGPCAMYRWASQNPPLGGEDHVHQRVAGYRLSAERLFEALIDEYRRYRARPIG
jgi:lysophospholipase L1-like esterase